MTDKKLQTHETVKTVNLRRLVDADISTKMIAEQSGLHISSVSQMLKTGTTRKINEVAFEALLRRSGKLARRRHMLVSIDGDKADTLASVVNAMGGKITEIDT